MFSILLAMPLFSMCPKPELINIRMNHPTDLAVLRSAPGRCKAVYGPKSCVKRLERLWIDKDPNSVAFHRTCSNSEYIK